MIYINSNNSVSPEIAEQDMMHDMHGVASYFLYFLLCNSGHSPPALLSHS
jgi:hypothetical protein